MRESPLEINRELVLHPKSDEADRETVGGVIRRVTIGIVHHQTINAVRGHWRAGRSPEVGNPCQDVKTCENVRLLSVKKMMNTGQLATAQSLEFQYNATEPICRNQHIQIESPPFPPPSIPP